MDVVVKAEDGTSQEKGLGNVHEYTTSDVLFVDCLVRGECDRRYYQKHCAEEFNSEFTLHRLSEGIKREGGETALRFIK